jgi:hypothetical protein
MSIKRKVISRAGSLAAAVAVVLGALVPAISPLVSAAGQVQVRSIQMSDSTPSQTGVTYKVTFTPATTGAESMVIDFCNDGSIIGSSCTPPVGFDASSAIFTSVTGMTGWDVDGTPGFASASTIAIHDTSAPTNVLGTSAISFELDGVTNSSDLGTFWARVYTYNDDSYGGGTPTGYVDPTDLGTGMVDYGGFAMSTATLINISATVMETLTFCTSKVAPGPLCGASGQATTAPNLTLGHGTPQVLDSTQPDTDTAYFQISTNAVAGALIRMKSHNACTNGGLSRDGGATCPIAGQGATPDAFATPNVAQFGLNVTNGTGGTGTVNAVAPYSTASNYAMDTTLNNDVSAAYGTVIANTGGTATASVNTLLTFAAQAAVTTPAGVYSVNESLIATGTY